MADQTNFSPVLLNTCGGLRYLMSTYIETKKHFRLAQCSVSVLHSESTRFDFRPFTC